MRVRMSYNAYVDSKNQVLENTTATSTATSVETMLPEQRQLNAYEQRPRFGNNVSERIYTSYTQRELTEKRELLIY